MNEAIFSAYTPTNNPEWIMDAYRSLLDQTDPRWEWILVPNGPNIPAICTKITEIVKGDDRVKIQPYNFTGSVGALKGFACSQTKGQILVELDHDDILVDNCFEEIMKQLNAGRTGFFYSDWVGFRGDGSFETFDSAWGWQTYDWEHKKKCKAVCAFEPSARSLCEIFYSPNHVRAWTKEAHNRAGGYDPSIKVADDHDLVCRTYLSGADFWHIKKPLYLYRIHSTNTVKLFNSDIQVQQAVNRDKYIHHLVFEECRRESLPILDLGEHEGFPSSKHRMNYSGLSRFYKWKLPYDNNSIGAIRAFDFLQLVPRGKVKQLIEELYRVLVPGGWLLTSIPSTDGRGAFQDPRHRSWWNENSWGYWTMKVQQDSMYPLAERNKAPKFQMVRCWTACPSEYHQRANIPYVFADMCALKGQRQPGGKYL